METGINDSLLSIHLHIRIEFYIMATFHILNGNGIHNAINRIQLHLIDAVLLMLIYFMLSFSFSFCLDARFFVLLSAFGLSERGKCNGTSLTRRSRRRRIGLSSKS